MPLCVNVCVSCPTSFFRFFCFASSTRQLAHPRTANAYPPHPSAHTVRRARFGPSKNCVCLASLSCLPSRRWLYLFPFSTLRFTVSVTPLFRLVLRLARGFYWIEKVFRLPFAFLLSEAIRVSPTALAVVFEHTQAHVHEHTSTNRHATVSFCCYPCDDPRSLELHTMLLCCRVPLCVYVVCAIVDVLRFAWYLAHVDYRFSLSSRPVSFSLAHVFCARTSTNNDEG